MGRTEGRISDRLVRTPRPRPPAAGEISACARRIRADPRAQPRDRPVLPFGRHTGSGVAHLQGDALTSLRDGETRPGQGAATNSLAAWSSVLSAVAWAAVSGTALELCARAAARRSLVHQLTGTTPGLMALVIVT